MVGIVILVFNSWNVTEECLNSLFVTNTYTNFHIYLVDNNSSTGPSKKLESLVKSHSSQITSITLDVNRGYNAGNNVGIKAALSDKCNYILISNNDVYYQKTSIFELVKFLEENPQVGIVGPKILLPNQKVQDINMVIGTTLKGKYLYLLRKTPLKFLSNNYVDRFSKTITDETKPFRVSSVSGACFMMSRECAVEVTPFDEYPFLYEEEVILGTITYKKRFLTVYNTESVVVHEHGASTGGLTGFAFTEFVRSEMYFCRKYLGSSSIKLFPLYVFRSIEFIIKTFRNSTYRGRVGKFFHRTIKVLVK